MWILLLDAYLVGAFLDHTLHCAIHDFTHWSGSKNMMVNKGVAILCNIPMGVPSAISFGRYHSDHHNFLSELEKDPDLPLPWEARLSADKKWYKYVFYMLIEVFYGARPIFMNNPSMRLDEVVNFIFIIITNYLIYHFWGGYALTFILVSGLFSIGPHPAAIHIIA
jgi:sphingolipid delta-4 desaturase